MTDSLFSIRTYSFEDLDRLTQFEAQVEKHGENRISSSPGSMIEALGLPNHHPEDNLFIAERRGEIIGYADVMPERIIRRAVVSCLIRPGSGEWNLSESLVERALTRAQELRLNRVHVNVARENVKAKRFFYKMDFHFVRRFIEMRLALPQARLPNLRSTTFRLRGLKRGEEEILTQIQNRSFTNTWGFNPNTVEEIVYRIGLPHCSPSDIILAYDRDKTIGYCWTRVFKGESNAEGGALGRIYMLGVDQDHRGKGVGSTVLAAGLSLLRRRGLGVVQLTVDSGNRAALTLYRAAGFEARKTSLWYEKAFD
jgi:mycothiol synthase